jgi:hypothetical protein
MRRPRDLTPGLAALLAVGAILGGLLVGYEPVGGDPDRIYRPIKEVLAESLRAGRWPFWSDRFGLGVPLVAESHAAAFYPPNWILYRLLGVNAAYRLAMWLQHVALAGATFAYARSLGIGGWGAALAAVAFTFCGFQAIHSSHEWAYHALPFLPLCLLLAGRYAADGGLAWLALLALAWGVQLTVGHFQVQSWTGALVLLTGGWRVAADRRPWWRGLGLAAGLAWGAAIAAAQLGPSWELAQLVGQTRRSFAELAFYSFPPAHWAEPAIPRLFRSLRGGPEDPYWFGQQTTGFEACLYVGTIPLILALVGLVARNRALTPWRLIVPASFALATLPRWWPAGYAALLQLPGLGYFRCPARYTAITSFGLALLAGNGLDRAISPRRFRSGLALAIAFGVAAFAWALAWSSGPELRPRLADAGLAAALALAAIAWGIGLAVVAAWRLGWLGGWAPLLATAAELAALYYAGTTRWGWSIRLPQASPILMQLAKGPDVGRVGGAIDNLPVRAGQTTATPYLGFPLPPPHRVLSGVQDRRGVANPAAARWRRRFGVTHAVWDGPASIPGAEVVFQGADEALDRLAYRPPGAPERRTWRILRLPEPWPAARVAVRALVADDRESLLSAASFAGPEDAWFLPPDRPPTGPRARSARVLRWDGTSGEVEHDGACDLVVCRTYYPGWTARIGDGPERPVRPVDGGLQAIHLEGSGISRVVLSYRPSGWPLAGGVSLAATAAAMLAVAVAAARRRAREG